MKILISILIFTLLIVWPKQIFAHSGGGQPFFKINGEYALAYHVPFGSPKSFEIPQDLAARNYSVAEQIEFEIDLTRMSVPAEIFKDVKFEWDFGDGTKAEGIFNSHKYERHGSYVLKIFAYGPATGQPQLFESVLVNIVPNLDYQLPRAIIKIENKVIKDSIVDVVFDADLDSDLKFDASQSESKRKIVEHLWFFSDQTDASGEIVKHKYDKNLEIGQFFTVLRIKDENGFIADTYAEVVNQDFLKRHNIIYNPPQSSETTLSSQIKYSVIGSLVLITAIYIGRKLYISRKTS